MKINPSAATILTIGIFLSLAGCRGNTPTNSSTFEPTNIIVNEIQPVESISRTEPIPLPNCAGSAELSFSLGSVKTIQKSVEIGAMASVDGTIGFPISEILKAELKAHVEVSYQQTYQSTEQRLDTILMKAAPHTHIIYEIEWIKWTYSSTITFENKHQMGVLHQVPYTYTLMIPKLSTSYAENCRNNNNVTTSTTYTPTIKPATINTSTPQPAKTNTLTLQPTNTNTLTPTPTNTNTLTPIPFVGYMEQPSFTGDCGTRPSGSVCIRYDDDYVWLVYDGIVGGGEGETFQGNRVVFAQGGNIDYYHVLNTNIIKGVNNDPSMQGNIEQPSFNGDCGNRPSGSVCIRYDDGFVWLVYDGITGWGEGESFQGNRVVFARGGNADYYHVLNTNLVKGVAN